jgi:hypothetical protein
MKSAMEFDNDELSDEALDRPGQSAGATVGSGTGFPCVGTAGQCIGTAGSNVEPGEKV